MVSAQNTRWAPREKKGQTEGRQRNQRPKKKKEKMQACVVENESQRAIRRFQLI